MRQWIEVYYCNPSSFGNGSWASGSTRMFADELAEWLIKRCAAEPMLITSITVLKEVRS